MANLHLDNNISIDQALKMNRAMRRKYGIASPGPGQVAHCHVKVRETAQGIARVLFEELARRNEIFAKFKSQHPELTTQQMEDQFVGKTWPQLIDQARATLAGMLRSSAYSEEAKEEIMDILVKDATLIRGRKNPATLLAAR